MAKREQAREESRFMKGDVGVDGRETEEEKDPVEAERDKAREQFLRGKAYLGREFLTWVLWSSESGEPLLEHDGVPVTVLLTDRLVLKGIAGEIVELTARGAMAAYSPIVRHALDRGMLVHGARLRFVHGERTYLVTLDAEHFDFRSAKLPALMTEEEDDQLQERLFLVEQLTAMVQALLEQFLRLRAGKRWKDVVGEMKAWMAQESAAPKRRRAAG